MSNEELIEMLTEWEESWEHESYWECIHDLDKHREAFEIIKERISK